MTEQQTGQQPSTEPAGSGRFALYDKTFLRFAGPVRESKTAAEDDKPEGAKRGRFEVREV